MMMLKIIKSVLFLAFALVIVLVLAYNGAEQQVAVKANGANLFKTNHQQYEPVQKPPLTVNHQVVEKVTLETK
jgi:hypothetical protein